MWPGAPSGVTTYSRPSTTVAALLAVTHGKRPARLGSVVQVLVAGS